jgi:uncharacterized repeat protein (TIGR01451 family)
MLPNGDILFAADTPEFNAPTHIYEFNPTNNSYTDVTPTAPNLSGTSAYVTRMLMLPSGQVLFAPSSSQLYVYTPSGSPVSAGIPTVSSVAPSGSNYTLTGTALNGISAGASYGDDAEMDTNYPIIELKNAGGTVYFARTFNWGRGVATGGTPVTTNFALPAGLPNGTCSLYVVANGIASNPFSFTVGSTASADVSVTNSGPSSVTSVSNTVPGTATEGDNVTYTITVKNSGSADATASVLTDTLAANSRFVSATTSQGSFTQSAGVVTFSLGTVASGQTVTATVTTQDTEDGTLSNVASVTSSSGGSASSTATTSVAEVLPVVSGAITVKGKKVNNSQVATFTHANGVEPASAFTATINWGDNTTSTGTVSLSGTTYIVRGSHNYSSGGSHTVSTTVVENGPSVDSEPSPALSDASTSVGAPSSTIIRLGAGTLSNQIPRLAVIAPASVTGANSVGTLSGLFQSQDPLSVFPSFTASAKRKAAVPQGPLALGSI